MAIYLLEATHFIEESTKNESNSKNEEVEQVIENPKIILKKVKRKSEDKLIEAITLLVRHAGFEEAEENALKVLRQVLIEKLELMARQFAVAQQRKEDGLKLPFKSPIMWVLALNGAENVLELKSWYDNIYSSKFENAVKRWKEKS